MLSPRGFQSFPGNLVYTIRLLVNDVLVIESKLSCEYV